MTRAPAFEAGGLLGLLAAGGLLFSRSLATGASYDEGVYLASADALARGDTLGEDVFASQPPGFYVLLRLALLFPGDSLDAVRLVFLGVAIIGVGGAWALGRALAGPTGGLLAGAVLLTAPSYAAESARVAADTPSLALALVALAGLAWALKRELVPLAVVAGMALAAAISVKLFAATALVAAVGLLVGSRASRRLTTGWLAGGVAVGLAFVAVHAGSLGAIYDDAVSFHEEARGYSVSLDSNADRLAEVFVRSGLVFFWLVVAGVVVWLLRQGRPRLLASLWLWGVASAAFLLWQRPLIDHHFVLIATSFAIPAGAALRLEDLRLWRTRAAAGALVLVLAAGYAQQARRIDRLEGDDPRIPPVVAAVGAATGRGEAIVSDLPLVAYLADRPLPAELVDTSVVRFRSGSLDAACVLAAADTSGVRLVVAGRAFRIHPGVLAAIRARFPEQREVAGITLLERSSAAARAAQRAAPGSCS